MRPTVATIDTTATTGKAGFAVGDRVRISGSGLYAGESATIEKLTAGVIPGALVRTEAGRTRQVRTVDLDPLPKGSGGAAAAAPVPVATIPEASGAPAEAGAPDETGAPKAPDEAGAPKAPDAPGSAEPVEAGAAAEA